MADSRLNLVLMRMGCYAAQNMVERLDIPFCFNPITFDVEVVVRNYQSLAGIIGKPCPDFNSEIYRTKLAIKATTEIVGDMPLVVDSSATMLPFALTKTLLQNGFNVTAVFAPLTKNEDSEEQGWLADHCPQLRVVQEDSYEALGGYGLDKDCIAIGYESAYMLQATHFVDIYNDETFYGFHGIQKLMRLIRKAFETKTEW